MFTVVRPSCLRGLSAGRGKGGGKAEGNDGNSLFFFFVLFLTVKSTQHMKLHPKNTFRSYPLSTSAKTFLSLYIFGLLQL